MDRHNIQTVAAGGPYNLADIRTVATGGFGAGGGFGPTSFNLPLNDLGAGVVNLVPAQSSGSPTATFTRATTAYTKLISGLWAPVAIGVARSSYLGFNDTPSAYGGYFAEGSRTNLLLFSNDLTNAAWVKTTMATAATSTGPDGIPNSATRVTATAGNALCLQTIVAAASSRTLSFWVKRITGAGNFDLTQDGVGFTTVPTTAGWTQVPGLTASILNATPGFRIVTNGDAFDVWCGQFEAGLFASSPIPTVSVAVTRNADQANWVVAGNINNTVGSAKIDYYPYAASLVVGAMLASGGVNREIFGHNGLSITRFDGTTSSGVGLTNLTNLALNRLGASWSGVAANYFKNGTASGSNPLIFDGNWDFTMISIGYGLNPDFGYYQGLQIYPAALSSAQMIALTA